MPHAPNDESEISLSVGDVVGVAGNHWNGYNKGTKVATNETGLYPEYKMKPKIRIVQFPTYPHIKL